MLRTDAFEGARVTDRNERRWDVVVAGAGIVGLALAAALKQALGAGVSVLVVDPRGRGEEGRATAIAPASRAMLSMLGAWEAVEARAQPIRGMAIRDGRPRDAARPVELKFAERAIAGEPLAFMAMSADVVAALRAVCERLGVERAQGSVAKLRDGKYARGLDLDDGTPLRARLLVAADGARSRLRAKADISSVGWQYKQSAIVVDIAHERDHEGRAEQHFLPGGPFAVLPLTGRRSSIVWTDAAAETRRMLALPAADFLRELELRVTQRLGVIELLNTPRAFPLEFRIARRFVAPRLALMGDAAHQVHPLAGQGVNLGLRDAAMLAEEVARRMRLGLDPGDPAVLGAYERARRFDATASGLGMDVMNQLFSNDIGPLRALRDFGLRLVDRAPRAKNLLIAEAAGSTRAAPRLLRGLAL